MYADKYGIPLPGFVCGIRDAVALGFYTAFGFNTGHPVIDGGHSFCKSLVMLKE